MKLKVKHTNGTCLTVELFSPSSAEIQLLSLKSEICKLFKIEQQNQRLIYKGKILIDDQEGIETLYKVSSGDTILLADTSKPKLGLLLKPRSSKSLKNRSPQGTCTNFVDVSAENDQIEQIESFEKDIEMCFDEKEEIKEKDPKLPPNTIVPSVEVWDPNHNKRMANSIPIYNMAVMDYHIDPHKVNDLLNMGFEYYQIVECLREAENDMNLAVEFCMNGIPNDEDDEEEPEHIEEDEAEIGEDEIPSLMPVNIESNMQMYQQHLEQNMISDINLDCNSLSL